MDDQEVFEEIMYADDVEVDDGGRETEDQPAVVGTSTTATPQMLRCGKSSQNQGPDALDEAILQELRTPQRTFTSDEHFYMSVALEVAQLPTVSRLRLRDIMSKALLEEFEKQGKRTCITTVHALSGVGRAYFSRGDICWGI